MTDISKSSPLQAKIDALEQQRAQSFREIKQQLKVTGQSLRPGNMIRDAAQDLVQSTDLKKLALKAGGAVAVAFILKQVLQRNEKKVQDNIYELHEKETFMDRTMESLMKFAGVFLAEQVTSFVQRYQASRQERSRQSENQPDDPYGE